MRLGRVSSGDSHCWVVLAVHETFRQIEELRSNDKQPRPRWTITTSEFAAELGSTHPSK